MLNRRRHTRLDFEKICRGCVAPVAQISRLSAGHLRRAANGCRATLMADSLTEIFTALRSILRRHAGKLVVSEDSPTRFCLEGGLHPKHRKPMPIAWTEIGKNYVSFHHRGVYACPDLLKGVSKKLRARMKGKSCFNFTSV